jgi:hypothetical protein
VQVIADPIGRLVWISPPLPGARHDMGAAREHGIINAITAAERGSRDHRGPPHGAGIGVPSLVEYDLASPLCTRQHRVPDHNSIGPVAPSRSKGPGGRAHGLPSTPTVGMDC